MKYVKTLSLHNPRDQSPYLTCTPDTESYNNRINKLQCIGGDGLDGGPQVGAIGPLGQVRL